MLTILVGLRKGRLTTADGKHMFAFPMLVWTDGKLTVMQEREGFGNIKDVEILVFKKYLPYLALRARLTEPLRRGITMFLQTYHAKTDLSFDCYAFANLVAGVPQHDKSLLLKYWNLTKLSWRRRVGDIVFFLGEDPLHFKHAAVYIGYGLYISVYGAGGDLEISTMRDMRRDYGAAYTHLAVPL